MAQENSSATGLVAEQLREDGLWVTLGRFCQLPYIEEDEDYTRPPSTLMCLRSASCCKPATCSPARSRPRC